jgi:hypothetical protein
LNRTQEVGGSTPLSSRNKKAGIKSISLFLKLSDVRYPGFNGHINYDTASNSILSGAT